jgi:hypothetical protein
MRAIGQNGLQRIPVAMNIAQYKEAHSLIVFISRAAQFAQARQLYTNANFAGPRVG